MSYFKASLNKAHRSEYLDIIRNPLSDLPSFALSSEDSTIQDILLFSQGDDAMTVEAERLNGFLKIIKILQPSTALKFLRNAVGLDRWFDKLSDDGLISSNVYKEKLDFFDKLIGEIRSLDALFSFEKDYKKTRKI